MARNIQIRDIWTRCKQEAKAKHGGYWANVIDLFRSYTRSPEVTEDNIVRYLIQQDAVDTRDLLAIQEEWAMEAATLRTELQRGLGVGIAGDDAQPAFAGNRTSGRGHPGVGSMPTVHLVRETADELKVSDGQTLYTFGISDANVVERFKSYMDYTPAKALDYLRRNAKLLKKETNKKASDLVDAYLLGADVDALTENAGYIYHNDYANHMKGPVAPGRMPAVRPAVKAGIRRPAAKPPAKKESLGSLLEATKRITIRCMPHPKIPAGHPGVEEAVKQAGNYVIDMAKAHQGKVIRADMGAGGGPQIYTIFIDMEDKNIQGFLDDLPKQFDSSNGVVVNITIA